MRKISVIVLLLGFLWVGRTDASQQTWFDDVTAETIQAIFAHGQTLGNHALVFAKVGDSITLSPSYLYAIGEGYFDLGEYSHLNAIIRYFTAVTVNNSHRNSYNHQPISAGVGWSAFHVFDTASAKPAYCGVYESPIACEYRTLKPSFAVILFGTNDVGYRTDAQFETDMRRIIDFSIEQGVIPILSTIPPQIGTHNPHRVADFNAIIISLVDEYHLPYMDYHGALSRLSNWGLTYDGLHPSTPPNGYEDTARLNENTLRYGYVVRNLLTLEILNQTARTALMQYQTPNR
jgi:hypothetical protein